MSFIKFAVLLFLVLTAATGCASTYYTDLPSRQPEVYTEKTFAKDSEVKRELEKAKKGELRFTNVLYADESNSDNAGSDDANSDDAFGGKNKGTGIALYGSGDSYDGVNNGFNDESGGESFNDESEAIIEALSERLAYYEGLQTLAFDGGGASGGGNEPGSGAGSAENASGNGSYGAENAASGSQIIEAGNGRNLQKKSAEDLISDSLSESMRTVSGNYNFVNSTTVYSYVKGMIYKVYYHPEHATSIKLQEGETISYAALGDTNNWTIETLENSEDDGVFTYILVRPYILGETDLHIFTDRRVYHFHLISTDKTYQVQVEFRYPDSEGIVSKPKQALSGKKGAGVAFESAVSLSQGVRDLNFNYKITGNASWKPIRAYSDTVRTYIQFANSFVTNSETPIVLLRHNGRDEIVDFTGKGITYIVPLILSTNEILVLKVGKEECYVGY